jgi:lactaldehyde dehydrogenase/sulfoacetaldehyde dehydrogenase
MSGFKVINPYTNQVLVEYAYDNRDKVESALKKVVAAKSIQNKLVPFERSNILNKLADLMVKHTEEIAKIIAQEIGKSISESRVEMARAIATITCSAEEARNITGEVMHSDAFAPRRDKYAMTVRKPLGVVLAITPFNFPINLAVHKIGPAFAAGNTILFKPGPQNYLSGRRLYELCVEAGMHSGMIEFIMPDVPEMNYLVSHNDINAISFTGGVPTAKAIARNCGMKKLLFELGGNDPLIVMDDGDIEKAVMTTINQRFASSGQRCTACKRLFIHSKVYAQFKQLLIEKASKLVMGDPLDEKTFIGPVVNEQAAISVEKRIQMAIDQGANLLLGGKRQGNMIEPTILENVPLTCELVADETFGPVVPLFKFDNVEDIISQINGTEFGLQSGVFTNNLQVIKLLFEKLEVGALAVNDGPGFRAEHLPFGGVKNSGLGREGVKYAIEEMSFIKTLIL